jgi:HTH-type transcriptional regulator, competence development regulator
VNDVAFDGVGRRVERLPIGVVPGDQFPLAISDRDDLTAHTVVLAPVEGIWKAEVKRIERCPHVIRDRYRKQDVVQAAIPRRRRSFYSANEGVWLDALIHQLHREAGCCESRDFRLSLRNAHQRGLPCKASCSKGQATHLVGTDALAARVSFERFVELARLKLRLSKEQFATKARIPLEELVCIEEDDGFTPTLRTVHYLAQFLKVSHPKLLSLACLASMKDVGFNSAAVKFAAKSEPIRQLTREEQEAFDEFVKVLSDR